jgi:hypothetical protein
VPKPQGLPPNLYASVTKGKMYYAYKHPVNKKRHGLGTNKLNAIKAARLMNDKFEQRFEIEKLLGGGLIKINMLCEEYRAYIKQQLTEGKLAQSTVDNRGYTLDRVINKLGSLYARDIKTIDITRYLNEMYNPKTGEGKARSRDVHRGHLTYLFKYALQQGYVEGINPAEPCLIIANKRVMRRHTIEGWNAIYNEAPPWLQNAMDLTILILQRRSDLCDVKFSDIKDGHLKLIQKKSRRHDSAYIEIEVTPELAKVIQRCKADNVLSPYLIHRVPEKRTKAAMDSGNHRTYITPAFLSRAFKEVRDSINAYPNYAPEEQPGIHQGKALGSKLYKRKFGESATTMAGHSSVEMTNYYEEDPDDIEWRKAVPKLSLKTDLKR